ncbi:hypothetical protein BDQ17DRAFT_530890 [Cyathus striatus]|nr:hypothetical protein BDQ17DRAFT_530890 [Cyathus striatus]
MEIRDITFGFALVSASEDTTLQSRLSDIRGFNEFHSFLLSPVRKLPDELLGEIFGHVIQGIQIGAQRSSIWDLEQVCVHWRNIVQATPLLWCSFSVWRTEVDTATMYHRIKSCLKFSRTVPMSISLFPRSFLKFPTQAFNDIADHADRLIHLSAHANVIKDMTATPSVEASIQRLRFSQLRKLVIHWQGHLRTTECALRLFRTAIALEEVDLGRIYPTNISEISWNRVKKLTWNYVSCPIHEFTAILRTMSCLEDLTWRQDAENDSLSSGEVIVLPSLRILNVCNGHFAQIWPILRGLYPPP